MRVESEPESCWSKDQKGTPEPDEVAELTTGRNSLRPPRPPKRPSCSESSISNCSMRVGGSGIAAGRGMGAGTPSNTISAARYQHH